MNALLAHGGVRRLADYYGGRSLHGVVGAVRRRSLAERPRSIEVGDSVPRSRAERSAGARSTSPCCRRASHREHHDAARPSCRNRRAGEPAAGVGSTRSTFVPAVTMTSTRAGGLLGRGLRGPTDRRCGGRPGGTFSELVGGSGRAPGATYRHGCARAGSVAVVVVPRRGAEPTRARDAPDGRAHHGRPRDVTDRETCACARRRYRRTQTVAMGDP